jgi:hypothetical protein
MSKLASERDERLADELSGRIPDEMNPRPNYWKGFIEGRKSMREERQTMIDEQLLEVWDNANRYYRDDKRPKDIHDKVFLAKCWEKALLEAMKKYG